MLVSTGQVVVHRKSSRPGKVVRYTEERIDVLLETYGEQVISNRSRAVWAVASRLWDAVPMYCCILVKNHHAVIIQPCFLSKLLLWIPSVDWYQLQVKAFKLRWITCHGCGLLNCSSVDRIFGWFARRCACRKRFTNGQVWILRFSCHMKYARSLWSFVL